MVWKTNLSFVSLLFLSVFISTHSAPSSPWNQAGLNLIFKPDLNRQTQLQQITKNKNNETTTTIHHHSLSGSGSGNNNNNNQNYQYTPHSQDIGNPNSNDLIQQNHNNHLSPSKSNNGAGGKTRKIAKTRTGSHSWGYTRYGQDIGHIRHMTNRKHLLPSNRNVPCPRDYIQTYNGKCRRIPKFSPSRVG